MALACALVLHGASLLLLVQVAILARARRPLAASAAVVAWAALFLWAVFPGLLLGRGPSALVVPGIAMWLTGRDMPLPVPDLARAVWMALTCAGCLLATTSTDALQARTFGPVRDFLAGVDQRPSRRVVRAAVLFVALPATLGWLAQGPWRVDTGPPAESRLAHPSIAIDEAARNPFREPSAEFAAAFLAGRGVDVPADPSDLRAAADAEARLAGREVFAVHCRPCHGMMGDGNGPLARGLRLRPADFTDPGTISSVVEPYARQRVVDGGPGLPPAGSPWDSAMPRWRDSIDDETAWLALHAAYDIAGVDPLAAGDGR